MLENPSPNSSHNNYVRKQNYVFRKWNAIRGMKEVRNPTGFSQNLKLTNVNHHKLSDNNQRYLRRGRRDNVKETENYLQKKAAENAERRKYVYNVNGMRVNANFKHIGDIPKTATLIQKNHASYPTKHAANIKQKFKQWAITTLRPNYNMRSVNIKVYKL